MIDEKMVGLIVGSSVCELNDRLDEEVDGLIDCLAIDEVAVGLMVTLTIDTEVGGLGLMLIWSTISTTEGEVDDISVFDSGGDEAVGSEVGS